MSETSYNIDITMRLVTIDAAAAPLSLIQRDAPTQLTFGQLDAYNRYNAAQRSEKTLYIETRLFA